MRVPQIVKLASGFESLTIAENPDAMITVIVPQAVPKYPWQALLHTNAAVPLKMALKTRKNVVITNVRYFLK